MSHTFMWLVISLTPLPIYHRQFKGFDILGPDLQNQFPFRPTVSYFALGAN